MTSPVACALTPDQLRDRKASLLPGLAARASRVAAMESGYVLAFDATDAEIVTTIGACIDAERHCCPFLLFRLTVSPDGAGIELDITGPTGTRAFLDALIA